MRGTQRPGLAEWQRDLAAVALHDDVAAAARLVPWLASSPVPAAAALRIHAEAVHQGLQTALAQRVPTVKALVGEDFFAELVRGYARRHPPQQPQLALWGAALPAFIRLDAGCQGLPYLADAAAFDLALDAAALAAPGEWRPPVELAPGWQFQALQSLRVFTADYAVDQLREAVVAAMAGDATVLESLRMERGSHHWALWCAANAEIRCRTLSAGAATFLGVLLGSPAEVAAAAAALVTTTTPAKDATAMLTALLQELATLPAVKLTTDAGVD